MIRALLLIFTLCFAADSFSQSQSKNWSVDHAPVKAIVENQGQFDSRFPNEEILFAYEGSTEHIFFCRNKIVYYFFQLKTPSFSAEEKQIRKKRKESLDFKSKEEWEAFEKAGRLMQIEADVLTTDWVNSSAAVQVTGEEIQPFFHSYLYYENGAEKHAEQVPSYQKIIYHDLYPFIDVEYSLHPQGGIKYNVILHPGADPDQIRLLYSKTPALLTNGDIQTSTSYGKVIDHAPVSFYQPSQQSLFSSYNLVGNEIRFDLSAYDSTQTVVIDPWTQTPAFATNWDCVWECETDAAGNAYIIGGVMPLQLLKYNTAGALQWTYNTPYDTTSWLGTFVTDNAGNSYVTRGSTAAMIKVNTSGALQWSVGNGTGMLSAEYWNIAFNCDQTKLVVGGTGGGIPPLPYIYDINPANGSILANLQVTGSGGLFNVQEVRAITATESEKYYWMTHDSIGYVSQVLNICPLIQTPVKVTNTYNLGYKCEDWRYNNSGIEALAYYNGYAYVNRGNRLDKRDYATGNITATVAIPGGTFGGGGVVGNSGIAIDDCGNIYVGSKSGVYKFDQSLTQLASYAVSFNVYDIAISTGGNVIAAGSTGNSGSASRTGTVTSIAAGACAPYAMTCCNASICSIPPLCTNESPVALNPETPGGTWSSTAPGFNTTTGIFDPSLSGVGTFTIYYTLACGMDSVTITVNNCTAMTVCMEPNGDLTVTGGTPPYTWTQPVQTTGCVSGFGTGCTLFQHTATVTTWNTFGSGVTVTPTAGADTVMVTDNAGATLTIPDITALPICAVVLPTRLIQFEARYESEYQTKVEWVTATEENNDYFTLLRSHNGIQWEVVDYVRGIGNSSSETHYQQSDAHAFSPMTYYRLQQTDLNGTTRNLRTIAVHQLQNDELLQQVHPNPARDQVYFTYGGHQSFESFEVLLINTMGQIVRRVKYENIIPQTHISMSIEGVPAGMYQLVGVQKDRTSFHKLIIAH